MYLKEAALRVATRYLRKSPWARIKEKYGDTIPSLFEINSLFGKEIRGKKFKNPRTGNEVLFSSLPEEQKEKMRVQFADYLAKEKKNKDKDTRNELDEKDNKGNYSGKKVSRKFNEENKPQNLRDAVVSKSLISGDKYNDLSLEKSDWSGVQMKASELEYVALDEVNMTKAHLKDTKVNMVGLSKGNLSGSRLNNVEFSRVSLDGTNLENSIWEGKSSFDSCVLDNANFKGADFKGLDGNDLFRDSSLKGADFTGAKGLKPEWFLDSDIDDNLKPDELREAIREVKNRKF